MTISKKKESLNDLLICLVHEMTESTINNSLLIIQNLKFNNVDITKKKKLLRQLLTEPKTDAHHETIEKTLKELENL